MMRPTLALPVRVGVWAVFVVLAGLIAMHGLGEHGTMSASADASVMPAHAGMQVEHATKSSASNATAVAPVDPVPGMDHLVGACLVVLGLGLALLLGLGRQASSGRRAWNGLSLTRSVPRRARAPDPPDLVRLSICRC